jgi:hypothetical protein
MGSKDPGWYKPGGNGPHPWGNGPKPKCSCSYGRAAVAVRRRRFRLAARYVRMDVSARLGII